MMFTRIRVPQVGEAWDGHRLRAGERADAEVMETWANSAHGQPQSERLDSMRKRLLGDDHTVHIVETADRGAVGVVSWSGNYLNYGYRIPGAKGRQILTKSVAVLIAKHFAASERRVEVFLPVSDSGRSMLADLGFEHVPTVGFRLSRETWTRRLAHVAAKFRLIG